MRADCRGDHATLDQHVIDRDARADNRKRQEVAGGPVIAVPRDDQKEDRERVHADPLEPAELAWREARDLREEEAAAGGDRSHDEAAPQLVAPDPPADRVERGANAEEREQPHEQEQTDEHLTRDSESREGIDPVPDLGRDHDYPHSAAG